MRSIYSIDIETSCGVESCVGYGRVHECPFSHALHFKKNKIDLIGVYHPDATYIFKTADEFIEAFNFDNAFFVGHNAKFDFKTIQEKCNDKFPIKNWIGDTLVQAVACVQKIPDDWLETYEETRQLLNKEAKKQIHRSAKGYSLKTLAPYFLKVEPFWEQADHNNDDYVLKDCEHTYHLYQFFNDQLQREETYDFYNTHLFPWNRTLYSIERRGITIDLPLLKEKEAKLKIDTADLKTQLDELWVEHHRAYTNSEILKVKDKYENLFDKAVERLTNPNQLKLEKTINRYRDLEEKAIEKLPKQINLNSPTQLLWLFKERLDYNVVNNEGKESVGDEVLQKLILEGKDDVRLFDNYRKNTKLLTSFFPKYREFICDGKLYCNFNIGGTRTGRLSSNQPNLQQVPPILRDCFIAPDDNSLLATFDESAIEPNMIAYYSEDETLTKILLNDQDFHGEAAIQLVEGVECENKDVKRLFKKERTLAKQVDLSLFYGSGVYRLQQTALHHKFDWSDEMCKEKLKAFKDKFKGVYTFKKAIDKELERNPITNIFGRKFRIPQHRDIYMKGFNTLIQSSASDIVLNSALVIDEKFKRNNIKGGVLLLVHDELVIEIPKDKKQECEKIIVEAMTNYPLKTQYGEIKLKVEGEIAKEWKK